MSSKIELPQPKKIKLDYSSIHYRGVFAIEDIVEGELIERCPMVYLQHRLNYHKDPQLFNYLYTHSCECNECKNHGAIFLLVMGYGMMYNHQDEPNSKMKMNFADNVVDFIATTNIFKNEEIFSNYGRSYFNHRTKKILNNKEISNNECLNID